MCWDCQDNYTKFVPQPKKVDSQSNIFDRLKMGILIQITPT